MKRIKRFLSVALCLVMVMVTFPITYTNAYSTEEASVIRNNLVDYFYNMATIKWKAGATFAVPVGSGYQTYFKDHIYYGIPYAQSGSIVYLQAFDDAIQNNNGVLSKQQGYSDCSTALGAAYHYCIPSLAELWSPSCFTYSGYGFSKIGSAGDYSSLLPGDVLYSSSINHVMMVVSVNNSARTVKVIHQSSACFIYDPKTDTTGDSTYDTSTRNCSWGVNQTKSFNTLASGTYQGYRYTALGNSSGSHAHDYKPQNCYKEDHPHYRLYRCSCGASYYNAAVTRKDPTCSICNPGEPYQIVNGQFPSGTINYGEDFQIGGTLYSTGNIRWVIGSIIDGETDEVLQRNEGKWPYTKTYDLSDLNDQLDFSLLPSGDYYFMLQAVSEGLSGMDVIWRPFTVPELFSTQDIRLPQGEILEGTDFAISGTIQCQVSVSWANCEIVDVSNGSVLCKTPSITTGNKTIDVSEFNNSLIIPTLTPGNYRFIVKAGTWKNGDMNNIVSYFTVVGSYTLSFDANGGDNAPADLTGNSKYIIPDSQCSRNGFILEGWSYWNDPSQILHPGDEIELTGNTRLVAVWKEHTHTLVLQDMIDASCTTPGYTGNQYCTACKQIISVGTTINALGHTAPDGNGNCTRCGAHIKDVTPTQPSQPQPNPNACKWCGQEHTGFFGKIVGFFHSILAIFKR